MKFLIFSLQLIATLFISSNCYADWSANAGWASDYHFRGIFQSDSSASAGIDYENAGFSVGAWGADVDDGLEVDLYGAYGRSFQNIDFSVGFTGYYYTGDFDDTYQEINASATYNIVTVDLAVGEYDNFSGPTLDYTFFSITADYNDFYGKFGSFSQDADGDYFEFGYAKTISEIDFGVALIFANDDLIGDEDESLVFTISKSFDF